MKRMCLLAIVGACAAATPALAQSSQCVTALSQMGKSTGGTMVALANPTATVGGGELLPLQDVVIRPIEPTWPPKPWPKPPIDPFNPDWPSPFPKPWPHQPRPIPIEIMVGE